MMDIMDDLVQSDAGECWCVFSLGSLLEAFWFELSGFVDTCQTPT